MKFKMNTLIIIIAVLIPVIIFSYILYSNVSKYSKEYLIDVGLKDDIDNTNNVYIKDTSRVSDRMSIGDTTFRTLVKNPIYFSVKPEVMLDNQSTIDVELLFQSDSDLQISLTNGKNFSYAPLYYKILDNYTKVADFDDTDIFEFEQQDYIDSVSVTDFLVNNVPEKTSLSIVNYNVSPTLLKKYNYKVSKKLTNTSIFVIMPNYNFVKLENGWYSVNVTLPYNTNFGKDLFQIALKATDKNPSVKIDSINIRIIK